MKSRSRREQEAIILDSITDGVFTVDGSLARLDGICALASKYDALVVVDDAHGIGVLGHAGRGTADHCQVADRVDLFSGTFSHALGGGGGGRRRHGRRPGRSGRARRRGRGASLIAIASAAEATSPT
mgnify:CR=1 FL=1